MNQNGDNTEVEGLRILLTSVGRRSYLVRYFQDALCRNGEVHVANSSAISPAFLITKNNVVTPLIYDEAYIPFLLDYCINNKIAVLVPLFDVDLPALAAHEREFAEAGVRVIVSSEPVVRTCNDKWETYRFCINHGFHTPKTFISLELARKVILERDLNFPIMLKPRWGTGSVGIFEANNISELDILHKLVEDKIVETYLKYESCKNRGSMALIQEKLNGIEYGLDVINDLQGEYQNTIVKRKHAMRTGETDCAETVESAALCQLGAAIGRSLHHIANLDVDASLIGDTPYLLEINARFGGGYPFSHMAGANLPLAIILD